ncbi:MAG: uracil-DNA glycosylase [Planctomycetota bacterium]
MSGADPRAEAIAGLARHLRRRAAMGIRRLGPGPVGTPAAAAPPPQAPAFVREPEPPVAAPPPAPVTIAAPPLPDRPVDSTGARTPAQIAPECLNLEQLRAAVANCRACELCQTRTQTVFMDGNAAPGGVCFVGEAPGEQEDRQGLPFVGPAGQLLNDIITKGMGLRRDQVTIANVLKCRPPGNRDPLPEEKALCTPFLDRQIELIQPRVLIPLGVHATRHLLGTEGSLSSLRGQVYERGTCKVVPTFHPAFLLRNPAAKRDCWQDIQRAMAEAGLQRPGQ